MRIRLKKEAIILKEVIIASSLSDPVLILEKVIDNIQDNYITEPYSMEIIWQKQYVNQKTNKLLTYSSIAEKYDQNGYLSSSPSDDDGYFRMEDACLYEYDSLNSKWVPVRYQEEVAQEIYGLSLRDYVHYRDNTFLNEKNFKNYTFDLEEFNEDSSVIRFKCENIKHSTVPCAYTKGFQGKIWIDNSDYSIYKIESELIRDFEGSGSKGEEFSGGVPYMVINSEYSQYNGKYYWSNCYYEDNFYIKSKLISIHTIKDIGKKEMLSDVYEIDTKDCSQQ